MEISTHSPEETKKLAIEVASKIKKGDVLALYGDLGSGKTTFTRFLVEALGLKSRVQSPTFVIARKYTGDSLTLNHIDLYRLALLNEAEDIGLAELLQDKEAISVIEWPEIAASLLPEKKLYVLILNMLGTMKEKSQYRIYIDTSERNNSKILLELKENGVYREVAKKEGQVDTTTAIKELLEENNIIINDIAEVGSNLGPGSFTGLRVSSTIANVLNWVLGKKKSNELEYPNYGREPNITPPKKFKL